MAKGRMGDSPEEAVVSELSEGVEAIAAEETVHGAAFFAFSFCFSCAIFGFVVFFSLITLGRSITPICTELFSPTFLRCRYMNMSSSLGIISSNLETIE